MRSVALDPDAFAQQLIQARAGNSKALGEIFEHFRSTLERIGWDLSPPNLRSKMSAEDLAQEAIVAAYPKLASFYGQSPREFLAWLAGFLHNGVRASRRRYGCSSRDLDREVFLVRSLNGTPVLEHLSDDSQNPAAAAIREEEMDTLHRALRQLPERHAQVVSLHFFDGCTFNEIARALCCSAKAAEMCYLRALAKLRDMDDLKKWGGGEKSACPMSPCVSRRVEGGFCRTGRRQQTTVLEVGLP